MIQKDIEALVAFEAEVDGIVDLTGNSGRRVRRVLERYFSSGTFDLLLSAPLELSNFQFACYMDIIMEGCEMAQDYVAVQDYASALGQRMTFAAQTVNVSERTYRLCISAEKLSETMKGRQAFLRTAAMGVRRIIAMIEMRDRLVGHQALEDAFFARFYVDDPTLDTEEDRQITKDLFDALLLQDYQKIGELPVMLVDLAGHLDYEVLEALRRAVEAMPVTKAA